MDDAEEVYLKKDTKKKVGKLPVTVVCAILILSHSQGRYY
jgi:hypothetical protein